MRKVSLLLILALAACAPEEGERGAAAGRAVLRAVSGASADANHDLLVDFGNATVGSERERRVVLRNVGDAEALLEPPAVEAPFGAAVDGPLAIPPGEETAIVFSTRLDDERFDEARTRIVWNDGALQVRLRAKGAGCTSRVDTRELRFGVVKKGAAGLRSVRIDNVGQGACTLDGIRIEGAAFSAEEREGLTILPGASSTVQVRFSPLLEETIEQGTLRLLVAGAMHEVALSGMGRDVCLAAPEAIDLGTQSICGFGEEGAIVVQNVCDAQLIFEGAGFVDATNVWRAHADRGGGEVIDPGEAVTIGVRHLPSEAGAFTATLAVAFADGWTVHVPVHTEVVVDRPLITEEIALPKLRPADVLLVIDDTWRMGAYAQDPGAIARNLVQMLDGADFHFGITTVSRQMAGGCEPAPDGRLLPLDGSGPRILDRHTPDLEARIAQQLASIPNCQDPAAADGLEAALLAIDLLAGLDDDPRHPEPADGNLGFLRENNYLQILFMVAGPDANPPSAATWVGRVEAQQDRPWIDVQSWIPRGIAGSCDPVDAGAYAEIPIRFDRGRLHDLCDVRHVPTTGSMDKIPADFGLESGRPFDPDGIEVRIDGAIVPQQTPTGDAVWRYSASENAIRFETGSRPPPASVLAISYRQAC